MADLGGSAILIGTELDLLLRDRAGSVPLVLVARRLPIPAAPPVTLCHPAIPALDRGEQLGGGLLWHLDRHSLALAAFVGKSEGHLLTFGLDQALGQRPDFVGRFRLIGMLNDRAHF